MTPDTILSFDKVTVRNLDKKIFTDLSFTIKKAEKWALTGESGSGKTSLLQTLAGNFSIVKGTVTYHFYETFIREHAINDPLFNYHKLISFVPQKHHFKNLSNISEFYYQQRYNSFDSEDAPTVRRYLTEIEASHKAIQTVWTFEHTVKRLHLEELLDKQLIKLSNGETRRLLLAASLLKKPLLLLLDNPFTGLDVTTRPVLNRIIDEIAQSGISIVLATSPQEIPDTITNVAILHECRIIQTIPRETFKPEMVKIPEVKSPDKTALQSLLSLHPPTSFTDIVRMENVSVKYGEKQILHNINWNIKQGERWALTGPNGAGKSTLLSLINGDNPQAYANKVILFDKKRGSGESIWDIKKKIGFVSPELFQYFKSGSSCLHVIESGFYDTLGLFRKSSEENRKIINRWMDLLEITESAEKPFHKVPASVQRLCLLARALVKNPPLLILDEPCQGFDAHQQQHFTKLIDAIAALRNISLIYVTHYQEELPECVNKILRLEKGEIT